MPDVFGQPVATARERIGGWHQVVRVDRLVEDDGPARGSRRLRLVNGGGLEIEVHPDRALDLGQVTVGGTPIAWMSPVGPIAPAFYEPKADGWLRTFSGGLLATCGLDTIGQPSELAGRSFGLHGRIGTTPATITEVTESDDEVAVSGTVRQVSVFGEQLVLRRRISSPVGSDTIVITDSVTNEGFDPAVHLILYHVNLGWPLLDESAVVTIDSTAVRPRDAAAEAGMSDRLRVDEPTAGFREQVFHHSFADGDDPHVAVVNERRGLAFDMTFSGRTLPYLAQWKMTGQGHYVLGLEPSNADTLEGRAAAEAAGKAPLLKPGERVDYRVEMRIRRM